MSETHRTFVSILVDNAQDGKKVRLKKTSEHIKKIQDNIIPNNFTTPYGERQIVYVDYTATGRHLAFVEDYIQKKVIPFYGNTHTSTSVTGLQTSCFRHEARTIIANATNSHRKDDVVRRPYTQARSTHYIYTHTHAYPQVLMTGAGSTSAINQMCHILHLDVPLKEGAKQPVVFVGPFEHHSNELPWRESCAKVVRCPENSKGHLCLKTLEKLLIEFKSKSSLMIGSFSACSNITGVLTDTNKTTALLHRHGALAFFDYATAGPYVQIDMNPVVLGEDDVKKDAVFISPHKFIGGPGSCGILIAKKKLFSTNRTPYRPGGGTVFFVTPNEHRYLSNRVEREEGGTPDIMGSIRAGLAFQIRCGVSLTELQALETEICDKVLKRFDRMKNVVVLARHVTPRLPVISFLIRHETRFLHHNFVSAVLNDVYGIQSTLFDFLLTHSLTHPLHKQTHTHTQVVVDVHVLVLTP